MNKEIRKNEISEEELEEVSGGLLGVISGFSEKELQRCEAEAEQ